MYMKVRHIRVCISLSLDICIYIYIHNIYIALHYAVCCDVIHYDIS